MKVIPVLFAIVQAVSAASVTVGTDNAVNAAPFVDGLNGITTYQQIYSSTAFSAPIDINSFSFFLDPSAGTHNQLVAQTIEISLSTTSIAVDGLYYHAPQGANAQTFGTFSIEGGTSPSVLTFDGTPFDYDPASGNLLVEIVTLSSSPVNGFTEPYYESDNYGSLTSRFCDESECNENQGLVTRFDSAIVPEPTSLAFVLAGVFGLVLLFGNRIKSNFESRK
jgi:hypothetical protein